MLVQCPICRQKRKRVRKIRTRTLRGIGNFGVFDVKIVEGSRFAFILIPITCCNYILFVKFDRFHDKFFILFHFSFLLYPRNDSVAA